MMVLQVLTARPAPACSVRVLILPTLLPANVGSEVRHQEIFLGTRGNIWERVGKWQDSAMLGTTCNR